MGTSKQDRQPARTAAQLERKYDWGKTFAEVFGLIDDAQDDAKNALDAVKGLDDSLDAEGVFNRLTDNGRVQGIYRDTSDNIYINASYIKSGTLAAERIDTKSINVGDLKNNVGYQTESGVVSIAKGTITADYINALEIKVKAANVTGKLTASQIDATNLNVSAANITGSLSANQIKMGGLMSVYETVSSNNLAGYFGYGDVTLRNTQTGNVIFSGRSMVLQGNEDGSHAVLIAPYGNIALAGAGDMYVVSGGAVRFNCNELKHNGKAIMNRLESFERAFNALGITFAWGNDD